MTMTLNLTEEQERVLREAAQRQQTSPENLVLMMIGTLAQDSGTSATATSSQDFEAIVEGVLRDNAELYRRLA